MDEEESDFISEHFQKAYDDMFNTQKFDDSERVTAWEDSEFER